MIRPPTMRAETDRLYERFRRAGDPDALAGLFDATAPELLAVARHLLGDPVEAEDVVQATFIAAIEAAGSFDGRRPVLPWLVGILTRQAGLARRARRRPEPDRLSERQRGEVEPDPGDALERDELRRAVRSALAELPEPYGEVLSLHLTEEARPREIARRLGRPAGTVRVQLHRGLALLRGALPLGLVGGAASAAESAAGGLALLREKVLAEAVASGASVASSTAAVGSGLFLGGTLVSKVMLGVGSAALVLGLGVWLASPDEEAVREATAVAAAPAPPQGAELEQVALEAGEPGTVSPTGPSAETPSRRAPASAAESSAPPPVASPPAESWSARGRVVAEKDGTPVAGARVFLGLELLPDEARARGDVPYRLLESDARGGFSFEELPSRPQSLQVQAEGFASTSATELTHRALREPEGRTVDFGDLALPVGVAVSGRVLDAASWRGLPEARVFQYRKAPEDFPTVDAGYAWQVATADAEGRFRVPLRLELTGDTRFGHGLLALTTEGVGWAAFELLDAEEGEREVELLVRPHASLEVLVLGAAGEPVEGAEVRVDPRFPPFLNLGPPADHWNGGASELEVLLAARTDATGVARFARLPVLEADEASPYRIVARVDGDGGPARGVTELAGPRSHHATVSLALPGTLVLGGRVTDREGRPLAGARVHAAGVAVEADAGGRYELALEAPFGDDLLVRVEAAGHAPAERALTREATLEPCDFVLSAALPIAGRVVDPDGEPVGNAHLSASYLDELPAQTRNAGTLTDAEGRFRFEERPEGRWRLLLSPPFREEGWLGMQHVVVEAGTEDVELVLRRAEPGRATVRVRVRDAVTGRPLDPEDVHVTSRSPFSPERDQLVQGARRVAGGARVDDVRPGEWRVWVRAGERVPGHADFDVRDDEELELEIELGAAGSLSGRVLGLADAVGRRSVQVELPDSGNSPSYGQWASEVPHRATPTLDGKGAFHVPALKAGHYRVRVEAWPFVALGEVDVRPGEEARLELEAVRGGWASFAGPDPEEPGYVQLRLTRADGTWTSSVHYGMREDGRFRTGLFLPPGPYAWEVRFGPETSSSAEPPRIARGQLEVARDSQEEVWVVLPSE